MDAMDEDLYGTENTAAPTPKIEPKEEVRDEEAVDDSGENVPLLCTYSTTGALRVSSSWYREKVCGSID